MLQSLINIVYHTHQNGTKITLKQSKKFVLYSDTRSLKLVFCKYFRKYKIKQLTLSYYTKLFKWSKHGYHYWNKYCIRHTYTTCVRSNVFSGWSGKWGILWLARCGTQRNDLRSEWLNCFAGDFCKRKATWHCFSKFSNS